MGKNIMTNTDSNKASSDELVKRIVFEFDDRHFPKDVGVPIGSKSGQVEILFSDETAISAYCKRYELEDTIASLINKKVSEKVAEAEKRGAIRERNEIALDNYRGHTFSDSTNYEAKFAKFIDNNEKRLATLKEGKL